jgi:hypothetical protein
MRRSIVLFARGIALAFICSFLTGCGAGENTAQVVSGTKTPQRSNAPVRAATVAPETNTARCDENTIPAYKPDFDKRGPLPGGGRTPEELWAKASALKRYGDNPPRVLYDPFPEYILGLPLENLPAQAGVICPNGDVYIIGQPGAVIRNAQFLNLVPDGGTPYNYEGRLFLHKASDAIGNQPCLAIVEIDDPYNMGRAKVIAEGGGLYIGCTNNGSFRPHPRRE